MTALTLSDQITFRPVADRDAEFLVSVYASTRADELAQVAWDETQKDAFVRMQFEAQRKFYQSEYPGAEFQIIVVAGEPAGRLYVHRREKEIRIMDIALLPPFRGRGVGTQILETILAEGAGSGRAVTIHVEVFNPAQRLYGRLGFKQVATNGMYHLMEWRNS